MIGCGHLTTFSPVRPVPGGERAAAALGAMGLMFALGLLLGALVCRLLRQKQLA